MKRTLLALAAFPPFAAHAADPERGLYLAAGGALRFLPTLHDYVRMGQGGTLECGWRAPRWSAGLLLAATAHNVTHYEIQAEDPAAPKIGGDVLASRLGAVGHLRPVTYKALALDMRAETGLTRWSTPIPDGAWADTVAPLLGDGAQKAATGFWAAAGPGLDLTLPVLEESAAQPRAIFEVLGGWQQAGNLSGPQLDLRMTLLAPL